MNKEKIVPELVVEKDALIGEGAVWDADDELLYWVDILGHEVYVYDPVSGSTAPSPRAKPWARWSSGRAAASSWRCTMALPTSTCGRSAWCPSAKTQRARFPPIASTTASATRLGGCGRGRWSLGVRRDQGALYCLDVDHSVSRKVEPVSVSNGIVWSADQQTMYFIDSGLNNVRAYDYCRDSGDISNERVVVEYGGPGVLDGMAIDEKDALWIAVFGGWCVLCYDPQLWGVAAPLGTADVQCDILRLWRRGSGPALHHFGLPGVGR